VNRTIITTAALTIAACVAMVATHPAELSGRASVTACQLAAHHVHATQDYTGSALERLCLGEEDDPRVGLALDYGYTREAYRAAEKYGR
jgi:hypothetical protein